MIETITGIILRTFNSDRVCLFTQELGKIFCTNKTKSHTLLTGSLVVANLSTKKTPYIQIEHINDISYPTITTVHDLAWLHHIVELYYFFMPEHQANHCDYTFLHHYITIPKKNSHRFSEELSLQKLAISHFLYLTGFYEDPTLRKYAKIFEEVIDQSKLSAVPFSLMSTEKKIIQNLILSCLQEHPQYNQFKTISFLYQTNTL